MKLLLILLTVFASFEANEYVTDLQSGNYLYLNSVTNMAMYGTPKSGKVGSTTVDKNDKNQHYYIEFNATLDSATIQHASSGTYIGYNSSKKMSTDPCKWAVYHQDDKTLFYTTIGYKNYILWPDLLDGSGTEWYAGLLNTDSHEGTTTALMACPSKSPDAINLIETNGKAYVIPFGLYDLIIQDGKKILRLK